MVSAMDTEAQMEQLISGAGELGIRLSESQVGLFRTYLEEILTWNKRRNIVSRNDEKRIAGYHFIDSLSALELLPKKKGVKCLDLGSGAGFPAIPMKIARPDISLTLAEPKRWRYLFLEKVVETLGLQNTEVFRGRAEELAASHSRHDVVLVRAVAKLRDAVSMAIPLLSPGGIMIAFKSKDVVNEMNQAVKPLLAGGAKVVCMKKVVLPLTEVTRVFVVTEKL
ncbi:16S rRNA (guanine(527)-N(7))-methyltransferase RsmG [candidate division TA06 bacterium]|uniref:Ribosomal RNA small subunit methyltransferase G n=1 Tax=candidate division TA06 bacterium TaxID=2250710 RepID=A0A523UX85_UNCT6|nr:MAG: 16S rRNA (guanine(527)-N(7))-methyltransferase RsmG [candidate division TA06 bacterium]